MSKICVGNVRNNETNMVTPVYLNEGTATTTCIAGKQGSGKTELQINFAKDIINSGECLICIDFVKNCELSSRIESITPEEKLYVVELSKSDTVWNQVDILELAREIDEMNVILFKLPQNSFYISNERDEAVNQLLDHILKATEIAQQKNDGELQVHLIIDELYQCKGVLEKFVNESWIERQRVRGFKTYISCLDFSQYKDILESLNTCGYNLILMNSSLPLSENVFERLEPFNKEDVRNLPFYKAIVSLKEASGITNTIVEFPTPISRR